MKCSLVLATLGRTQELTVLFESLRNQTHQDFEVIIVDQNRDGRLDSLVAAFSPYFPIRHLKVDFTGNARARNVGIEQASGEIVGFPDDDCTYGDKALETIVREFKKRPDVAVLVGACYEFASDTFSVGVNSNKSGYFSRFSMMGTEATEFFCINRLAKEEFHMDPDFGIGSKYPGAEGFEMLYRLMRAGAKAFYTPHIRIYHENKDSPELGPERMLKHSVGVGCYIRKFVGQKDWGMAVFILRKMLVAPVAKLAAACIRRDSARIHYSLSNLIGVWRGFRLYGSEAQS